MNRRGFLSFLGAALAGAAVDQVIPLGRVWSFPKEIVIAPPAIAEFLVPSAGAGLPFFTTEWVTIEMLRILKQNVTMAKLFEPALPKPGLLPLPVDMDEWGEPWE